MSKKRNIWFWLIALVAGAIVGCTNRPSADKEIFVVDPNLSDAKAAEQLAQKMEYKLMQFQTPDSIVFAASASSIVPGRDSFFVYDHKQDQFLVFNREGKFLRNFSRRGQGPEEYTAMLDFAVDDSKLYILDFTKLKIYDLDGKYLNEFDVDGARGQIAVGDNQNIYLQRGYYNETQLQIYSPEGKLIADMFPSKEVLYGFEIPSAPIGSIGRIGKDVYFAPPFQNTIFSIADTVAVPLATFDFGTDNIPDDFFDGDTQQVEDRFHKRRDGQNGFVYMETVQVSPNWIIFTPTWSPDKNMVLADRATNSTYTDKTLPEVLSKFLGVRPYFDGYDSSSDSFIKLLSADRVEEVVQELESDSPDYLSNISANVDLSDINEDDGEFLLFVKIK